MSPEQSISYDRNELPAPANLLILASQLMCAKTYIQYFFMPQRQ